MQNFNIKDNQLSIVETNTINLQKNEAIAISLFTSNFSQEICTLYLRANRVRSPAQCIWRLKQKGAIIEASLKVAIDKFGCTHNGIAHYKLIGWLVK